MNATERPGPGDDIAGARDLVALTLQGAEANERPDLISRLTAARHGLIGPTPQGRQAAVRTAAGEAERALESLEIDLRCRQAMLSDPGRTVWLRAEQDRARHRLEDFQARSREWPMVLGEGFADIHANVESHVLARVRGVLTDADEAIAAQDPTKNRDRLDSWLGERLAAEARTTYTLLHNGARRVAAQLADQLDLPGPPAHATLPVTPPDQLVAELPGREPAAVPSSLAVRMLTVVMPTYGGLMMALVLPRFAGLVLPGWLVAVCAVLGALSMGGAAVMVERQRQLDRRRSEANLVVRATVEQFQLALIKQTRDAVRVLQRDLRRAATAAVTRRISDLSATLDTARTAADTAGRASAELSDIGEDLNSVNELRDRARSLLHPHPQAAAAQPIRERVLKAVP
jgi:hypothetical protein